MTVLWEARRRGALADRTLDVERVRRICDSSAFAGAAEHLGEQVVQASLVRTAAASARQVRALADDESLPPGRLLNYALHALGPLDEVRRRWRIGTDAEPGPSRTSSHTPAPPPAARIDAARSRSSPHRPVAAQPAVSATAPRPSAQERLHRRSPA